jgi:hypothetical protein
MPASRTGGERLATFCYRSADNGVEPNGTMALVATVVSSLVRSADRHAGSRMAKHGEVSPADITKALELVDWGD